MSRIRAFGEFLYDFVIGDDWRIAAGVVLALGVTALAGTWWILPAIVAGMLAFSVWTVARARP
jgi:acetyltransferase-like isoleucine patch superfamily enzyme